LANSETTHSKSMLFAVSASMVKIDKLHSLSWEIVECSWFLYSVEHRKRSFSFRVSDGQCQVPRL